ncbi:MAG: tetratricopeptide repeat protein [Salibacteraceae bacterium]
MERKKNSLNLILIVGLLFSISFNLNAQSIYHAPIYEAYSRGKMDVWLELMGRYEKNQDFSSEIDKIELVKLYYGYTAWLISVDKDELAEGYIGKSEELLDDILGKEPENSTAMALKGAFIAFEISISNLRAIYLGRTSMQLIEDALELDPDNIQANIEMGNANFYSPPVFGGDKELSIKYYKKAALEMEINDLVVNNWLYLNVMTTLGMAYEATDQFKKAKLCYEKILRVKPNFMWVGEELLPDMLKRQNL